MLEVKTSTRLKAIANGVYNDLPETEESPKLSQMT